jgi:dihydropteroate synthase
MRLRLKDKRFDIRPGAPLVMGIVNIGADSVADPLLLGTLDAQVEFAMSQSRAGAQILDVGVQSGRTDTAILSEEQEIEQLVPLVQVLARERLIVSVDTWRPRVAAAAVQAGAALINDVSGLLDDDLAAVAAAHGAGLVVMHTRAAPKEERFPGYEDPLADIIEFLEERIAAARNRGLGREQLIVDPGLDFAKTPQESIEVLRRLPELGRLDLPILLAVSRKYFIGMLTGRPPTDRLAGTLAAVEFGVAAGAHIVRVHDVAAVADFLRLRRALSGDGDPELAGDPEDEALKWLAPKQTGTEIVRDPKDEVLVGSAPQRSRTAGAQRPHREPQTQAVPPGARGHLLGDSIAYLLGTCLGAGADFVIAKQDSVFEVGEMMERLRALGRSSLEDPPSAVVRGALQRQLATSEIERLAPDLEELDRRWAAQRPNTA